MAKTKLLFVNGHMNIGGVEKSLLDLLYNLDYNKYDVDLLLVEEKGDYFDQLPKSVSVRIFESRLADGEFIKTIVNNIKKHRWDIVRYRVISLLSQWFGKQFLKLLRNVFNLRTQYDAAIAYRIGLCSDIVVHVAKTNKRFVWWHNGRNDLSKHQIDEYRNDWQCMDAIVTVSGFCKNLIARDFSYPVEKIRVIPNMLDYERISKLADIGSPYDNDGKLHLVSVGRLCQEKHFEDVIACTRRLLDNGISNFQWYIIGDGELRQKFKMQIDKLDVSDYCILLGKKDNPYPWIQFADIFVHPSYIESQSITVLEAMALETPCVVCRSSGPVEFMEDGIHGIMTDKNSDSLYEGIIRMLATENRTSFIKSAKAMVTNKFGVINITQKFNELINNQT